MEKAEPIATVRPGDVLYSTPEVMVSGKLIPASDDFDECMGLAALLANGAVISNSFWWEKDWPPEAQKKTSLAVDCSDVFAWGCADAQNIDYDDLEQVYRHWIKDRTWGAAVWCIIKRKELPQRPVDRRIRAAGIWDLDALQREHGLVANHYDGVSGVLAGLKYDAYCAWEKARGVLPKVFDANWWAGWKEFTDANPGWSDPAWKAAEAKAIEEWRAENGRDSAPAGSQIDA